MDILEQPDALNSSLQPYLPLISQLLYQEENPSTVKFDAVMSVLSFFTALLLLFVLFLLNKVYRLVKFSDMPMLLSVASIAMCLACLFSYCILSVVADYVSEDNLLNTTNILREIDFSKNIFLFCSLVFDIYKWGVFLIATSSTSGSTRDSNSSNYVDLKKERYRKLKIALVAVQASMLVMSTVMICLSLALTEESVAEKVHKIQYDYIITVFSAFLIVYFMVFIVLTQRLKLYYPKFYAQERQKIFISNISIMLAICFRISINVILTQDWMIKMIDESITNSTWFFPMYQLIVIFFASYFPIIAITYSLMYGITNKKRIGQIDQRVQLTMQEGGYKPNSSSIGSLLEFAENEDGTNPQDFDESTEAREQDYRAVARESARQNLRLQTSDKSRTDNKPSRAASTSTPRISDKGSSTITYSRSLNSELLNGIAGITQREGGHSQELKQ